MDTLAQLNSSADQAMAEQQLSPPKPGGAATELRPGGMPSHFAQPNVGSAGGSGGGAAAAAAGDSAEEAELAAAIAASLAGSGGAPLAAPEPPAAPPVPTGPTAEEVDAIWGPPPDEPADGMLLKIRTPAGTQMVRKFDGGQHTLRDLVVAVHYGAVRLDPNKSYKLSMQFGPTVTDYAATLTEAGVQRGAYNISER